jgi:uncharacterized RDD family membrane protein YckC
MKEWHCALNGQTCGPFDENRLREMAKNGSLTADSLVWNGEPENAAKGWQKASDTELSSLFAVFEPTPPSPPGPPAPPISQAPPTYGNSRSYPVSDDEMYASRMKRLMAVMLDSFIAWFPILILVGSVAASVSSTPSGGDFQPMLGGAALILFLIAEIVIAALNCYYLYNNGQTIGKKILGVRIVRVDGSRVSFITLLLVRGLLKNILNCIPFFAIVDTCFIFRDDRRTLHDMMAGTIVVDASV